MTSSEGFRAAMRAQLHVEFFAVCAFGVDGNAERGRDFFSGEAKAEQAQNFSLTR